MNDKRGKFLMIHADDFGMCHSVNSGTIKAIENGFVNSVSIMPPCIAFDQAIDYIKSNPELDFGVHLTLTSEWDSHKWGPVSSKDQVQSLVNENGFFHKSVEKLFETAIMEEVETELRAQIEKVIATGVRITHIDSHMLVCLYNEAILKLYVKLGKEYNVPVLLIRQYINYAMPDLDIDRLAEGNPIPEFSLAVPSDLYTQHGNMNECYDHLLKNLSPGLTVLLIHAGIDNPELRKITQEQSDFGARWRQGDTDFFTSRLCEDLLKVENIRLTTWEKFRNHKLTIIASK